MKVEQLKLYNKYKNTSFPDIEYIYIGIDSENYYSFLIKEKNENISYAMLIAYDLNPDKIVKDLNLETFIDRYRGKHIKDYNWDIYIKQQIEKYFKPILKDKLNNILNR